MIRSYLLAAGCPAWGLLLAACVTTQEEPLTLQGARELKAQDYDAILKRWTRKDEVYDGLDSKLFVYATFHSPEFRRVFLLRHTDVYGQGSEEASRLTLTTPGAEEHLEFFFSASSSSPPWNDFDRRDSIWRVTLEGDGGERVDGKVERIKTTANLRVIYPYITDFARTYAVRFPRTTVGGHPVMSASTVRFVLRLSSALGEARLVWTLKPTTPTLSEDSRPADSKLLPGKELEGE